MIVKIYMFIYIYIYKAIRLRSTIHDEVGQKHEKNKSEKLEKK